MSRIIILLGLLLLSGAAQADHSDVHRGMLLYKNHCGQCHTPEIHQRQNSKIKKREDILKWVIKFQNHLQLGWDMHDADQVADYLNDTYYQFK